MRKITILIILTACVACSSQNATIELDPVRRGIYTREADLIFEGALIHTEIISRETTVDAVENHPDLRYCVTFKILAYTKGSFKRDLFRAAVHSPALSFQVYPSEYASGNKKRYRVYIKSKPQGTLIAQELIAAKK
ncbi:MAG: hypothetical protein ABH865_06105 [Candidatus Omnitrophota bacterium]|nr:hypothetical protein [Candidatus Omnitrophota bacterium]